MGYKDYKYVTEIQVRFSDIDRLNHVNNACYHSYAELGRVRYLSDVLGNSVDWQREGFILARTEIDHIHPIFLNDTVLCFTRVSKLGNKSLEVRNSIVRKLGEELQECAAIRGVLVAMDYAGNTSIPLPDKWRNLIARFEKIRPV